MDSGFVENHQTQAEIIEEVIKKYPKHYRLGNYHNPILPSCADFKEGSNDMLGMEEGKKWWVPLFDQNNFTAVF